MTNTKKNKTRYPGVRYRERQGKTTDGKPDRCFFIRYKKGGRLCEEVAGWASSDINAIKASEIRAELIQNIREGRFPQSLKEKREMEEQRRDEEAKKAEQVKRDQYSFDQAAQAFLDWARVNKKSWKDDESRYSYHVKPVIGHIPLKDVSPLHLERIRSNMKKAVPIRRFKKKKPAGPVGLSEKTIHLTFTLIRSVYKKQIAWGLYSGPIPTEQIKWPLLDNNRTRFLSHEEAGRLLDALKKSSLPVYCQTLLSLHCGLRFSEIAKLQWSDVDLLHGVLYIRDTKSGRSREAYITQAVKDVFFLLGGMGKHKKNDLVFPDRSEEKKQQVHASSTFYRTVESLKFNDNITDRRQRVCFHTLRHSFGSWLALQGTSLYEIKELMGHSDIKMTERYSHLLPSVKRDAVNRMSETFNDVMEKGSAQTKAADGGIK